MKYAYVILEKPSQYFERDDSREIVTVCLTRERAQKFIDDNKGQGKYYGLYYEWYEVTE